MKVGALGARRDAAGLKFIFHLLPRAKGGGAKPTEALQVHLKSGPQIPHPTPHALHHTTHHTPHPQTQNPKPETQNPKPKTQNPKPNTQTPIPKRSKQVQAWDMLVIVALNHIDDTCILRLIYYISRRIYYISRLIYYTCLEHAAVRSDDTCISWRMYYSCLEHAAGRS